MAQPTLSRMFVNLRKSDRSESDRALLGRFLRDRSDANFRDLVERHGKVVLSACRQVLTDRADIDDAFQATFLVLFKKSNRLDASLPLGSWLYAVAHRIAVRCRSDARRRNLRETEAIQGKPSATEPPDLSCREAVLIVHEELNILPEAYRLPLLLCCVQGLTRDEAATELNATVGAIRGQLERGRALLEKRLLRRGVTLAVGLLAALSGNSRASGPSLELIEWTLRTVTGQGSSTVAALAKGAVQHTVSARMKLAFLLVVGAALGIGVGAMPMAADPPKPMPEKIAKPPIKKDLFGDPLPDGAALRLGTIGFRQPGLTGVGFRKSGELVAVDGFSNLQVWPAEGGTQATAMLIGEKDQRFYQRTLSADGRFAAGSYPSADRKKSIVAVWDLSGEKPKEILTRSVNELSRIDLSANGEWLAVNEADRKSKESLLVCYLPTQEWTSLAAGVGYFEALAFTADGKGLAVTTDRDVAVVDLVEKKITGRISKLGNRPSYAALSPDRKSVAVLFTYWTMGPDPKVRRYSVETSAEIESFDVGNDFGRWVNFAADGKTLWTGGRLGLREWDPKTGKSLRTILGPGETPAAFSADGKRVASCTESAVLFADLKTGQAVRPDLIEGGHTAAILGIAVAPDGKVIATDALDGTIRLWDSTTGRTLGQIQSNWGNDPRVVFLDSKSFIAIDEDYITPVIYESATGKELRRFVSTKAKSEMEKEMLKDLRLSADGKTLTTKTSPIDSRGKSHTVRWDVETGKELDRIELAGGEREEFLFVPLVSPDGKWSVRNGTLLKLGEKEAIQVIPAKATNSNPAKFSSDSQLVAIGRMHLHGSPQAMESNEGSLVIYELATKTVLCEMPVGRTMRQIFAPDGRTVAVINRNEVAVWEIASGKKIWGAAIEHGNMFRHRAIAFTPDGRRLITGHESSALVWDVTGTGRLQSDAPPKLSAETLSLQWEALAGNDAVAANKAMWELMDRPAEAINLFGDKLKPIPNVDDSTVNALVVKLGDRDFAAREAASKALLKLGSAAVPALRNAMKSELTEEQTQRAERILAELNKSVVPSGEALRQRRAIAILERIGNESARKILLDLAGGFSESRVTRDAAASLARLKAAEPKK